MNFFTRLFTSKKKKLQQEQKTFEEKIKFHTPLTAYRGGKADNSTEKAKSK